MPWIIVSFLVLYIGLSYSNIEARIAQHNIDRAPTTSQELDVEYLFSLSHDAIWPQARHIAAYPEYIESWYQSFAEIRPWYRQSFSYIRAHSVVSAHAPSP